MAHEFIAYIDESGDDGLTNFRVPGVGGSSNWLVLGCCIVRTENDLSLVQHRNAILHKLQFDIKRDIHFTKLDHPKKTVVVGHMAEMPIMLSHVLCCKRHIPNPRVYNNKSQLYWYLCRMLIERISWFCAKYGKTPTPVAKIIFSNRGGMKYQEFKDYLLRLKGMPTRINWASISIDEIESEQHVRLAGLQFADCAAGAFSAAVEMNFYGNYEHSYALALRPKTYRQKGNFTSFGVKHRCSPKMLDARQKEFFGHFGMK